MGMAGRQILAQAVRGRSDEEIHGNIAQFGGASHLLSRIFGGMVQNIDPGRAQDCTVGFSLRQGDAVHHFTITVEGGRASVEEAAPPQDARVVFHASVPDFLRLLAGELNGMQAFQAGKVRADGDLMFVQEFFQMFRQPQG